MFSAEDLQGTRVLLTGPDGQEHSFTCGAIIPLGRESYVLLHGAGPYEGQMLVTRVALGEDGTLNFEMLEDEQILENVLGAYVASSIQETLENAPEELDDSARQPDNGFFDGNGSGRP